MGSSGSFANPTNECHLTGFWTRIFQSRPSIPSDLVPISQLCFYLRKCRLTGIIPTCFQTKFCLRTYYFPTVQPTPSISCLLVSLPHHNITQTVQVMHLVVEATRSLCPTKHNSEMPVPCCEHFFVVILSPEIGWNKPLNIRDTPLLQVTR
jgi:hypothetical protein